MKPEFICIGAQKAGTTWLYARLREHPEFSLPPIKEMHYFDRSHTYPSPSTLSETKLLSRLLKPGYIKNGAKTILRALKSRNLGLASWWMQYYFRDFSDSWYLKLYEAQTRITGDITPSYSILTREDIARMHEIAPQARLVFLMRDPIQRAWSQYRMHERHGHSIILNDLGTFKAFVDSPAQELRSNYLRTIDLYLDFFDSSQLLLGFYDAITDQPEALLSEILKHIGAKDTVHQGNLRQINNKSRKVDLPESYRRYLESKYCDDLEELATRYGGYASRWLASTKKKQAEKTDGANRLPPVAQP
ncbi:MAG: hypothetical protein A0129_15210 [Limnobacter sp. CACIAM 66H1]|uniref:sulfotransferase n=1 Tax=Limnobacter sp. CACIAM 66H1 TaxID=1813033 RepID=UPI0007A87008|nr:sulfotransferase [Limnobacter sp. CACIAM 66H1]KYP10025.1 MAG: hypothetical protein A0129_15210 [Limnobacter sp. CACIAM 66H1]